MEFLKFFFLSSLDGTAKMAVQVMDSLYPKCKVKMTNKCYKFTHTWYLFLIKSSFSVHEIDLFCGVVYKFNCLALTSSSVVAGFKCLMY